MAKNTLLVTVTAFDDVTRLAYSVHFGHDDRFGQISQCDATADAWAYLTDYLPSTFPIDDVRISVIQRVGSRATSMCCGHSLTSTR